MDIHFQAKDFKIQQNTTKTAPVSFKNCVALSKYVIPSSVNGKYFKGKCVKKRFSKIELFELLDDLALISESKGRAYNTSDFPTDVETIQEIEKAEHFLGALMTRHRV